MQDGKRLYSLLIRATILNWLRCVEDSSDQTRTPFSTLDVQSNTFQIALVVFELALKLRLAYFVGSDCSGHAFPMHAESAKARVRSLREYVERQPSHRT